jgi:hypothetical protein
VLTRLRQAARALDAREIRAPLSHQLLSTSAPTPSLSALLLSLVTSSLIMAVWTIDPSKHQTNSKLIEIKRENFHDLFGIMGCLLYCKKRRATQIRGHPNKPKGAKERDIFTLTELEISIANGCQSCSAFRDILAQVSLLDHHVRAAGKQCVFHISAKFTLKREITVINAVDNSEMLLTKEVVLFHPMGMRFNT